MIAFVLCFLLLASSALAAEVPVEVVDLHPLWEVGGEDDEDVLFGVLSDLAVDAEGDVYVVDRQLTEVTRFGPDGSFLGFVGREGEGPGEYSRIGGIFVAAPDMVGVVQRMPGKIVTVRRDGTPGDEVILPAAFSEAPAYFFGADRAGTSLVLSIRQMRREDNAVSMTTCLVLADSEGHELARMSETSATRDMARLVVDERDDQPAVWAVDDRGFVYVNDAFDAYAVRVYRPDGMLDHEFHEDYEPRKRSAAEKEANTPRMVVRMRGGGGRGGRAATGVPSPTDRDIQAMFARPDGSLWILTSRGAFDNPAGILATFDVHDGGGKRTGRVALKGEGSFRDDGIHIVGDRVYVARGLRAAERAARGAEESEAEEVEAAPMSLACYQLATATSSVAGSGR